MRSWMLWSREPKTSKIGSKNGMPKLATHSIKSRKKLKMPKTTSLKPKPSYKKLRKTTSKSKIKRKR